MNTEVFVCICFGGFFILLKVYFDSLREHIVLLVMFLFINFCEMIKFISLGAIFCLLINEVAYFANYWVDLLWSKWIHVFADYFVRLYFAFWFYDYISKEGVNNIYWWSFCLWYGWFLLHLFNDDYFDRTIVILTVSVRLCFFILLIIFTYSKNMPSICFVTFLFRWNS